MCFQDERTRAWNDILYGSPGRDLTFSRIITLKDQKKSREKVELPDEHLPARTGRRTSPATGFSSRVAHHLCVPGSRPGGQSCANTAEWSTGQPAHGPGGLRPAPGRLAAPPGLAAQAPHGTAHAVATVVPPQAKAVPTGRAS